MYNDLQSTNKMCFFVEDCDLTDPSRDSRGCTSPLDDHQQVPGLLQVRDMTRQFDTFLFSGHILSGDTLQLLRRQTAHE